MRIDYPLFVLMFILHPNLALAKEEKSKKSWSGPLIVVLYIGLILLTAAIAVWLRRYRDGRLLSSRRQRAGLDSEEIDSLPSLRFSEIKMHGLGKGDEQVECAVCLNEFKDQELLRVLPDCYHAFHPNCIAPWLATHITCPICRSSLEHMQGSSISRSSIIDGISGPFSERFEHSNGDHDNNNDNQFNVQFEGSSNLPSAEVNILGSSQLQINCCIGTLPRSHSTGDLMIHMVGNFGTPSNIFSTTLSTKECSPKRKFHTKVNKVDHWSDNISPKSDSFIDYSSINV